MILQDWTGIEQIDSGQITVDSSSAVVESVEDRFRGVYAGRVNRRSGYEYYGVVVSVFDSGGSLIYQGISQTSLDDRAATAIPRNEWRRVRSEAKKQVPPPGMHEFEDERGRRPRDREGD